MIDAVSYLGLHRVFTANMTGNVIFIGLGVAGISEIPLARSLYALAGFLLGALVTGRLSRGTHPQARVPGRCVITFAFVAAVLAGCAVTFAAVNEPGIVVLDALTAVLGTTMGAQAAAARRLAVTDLSTVVVTMTLTSLAADSRLGDGGHSRTAPRLAAAVAMLIGALAGALLLRVSLPGATALAAVVAATVSAGIWHLHRVISTRCWPSQKP